VLLMKMEEIMRGCPSDVLRYGKIVTIIHNVVLLYR
jgi:hypothetical protein